MCVVVSRRERRGPFHLRRIYLNTAGEDEEDETVVEHNALLCLQGWENSMAAALRQHVDGMGWDEFAATAMADGPGVAALASAAFPGLPLHRVKVHAYYVDLAALQGSDGYLAALSSNARSKLRRNHRLYGDQGSIEVSAAGGVEEALAMLDELAALHQATWKSRGQPGVFASESFAAFQRALVRRTFDGGGIQLLRVRAGSVVVGLVYNFIHRGRVSFYQSGLNYRDDAQASPGYVVHAAAVQHCLGRGLREYDFMAGESQYKRTLATHSRLLSWMTFARPTLKRRVLTMARRLRP
jgi:CelD/BcsL family acetyltransferase involved in cellulose biosynthesis